MTSTKTKAKIYGRLRQGQGCVPAGRTKLGGAAKSKVPSSTTGSQSPPSGRLLELLKNFRDQMLVIEIRCSFIQSAMNWFRYSGVMAATGMMGCETTC